MFIRVWSKFENVGSEDCGIPEHYVAIRYVTRFYSRKYGADKVLRYLVAADTETFYIAEETFEYLKSLKLAVSSACAKKRGKTEKSKKKTLSILGVEVGEVG